jgi:hypothetical protein
MPVRVAAVESAGRRRSSSATSAALHVFSSDASREAFFRKSDGPSASPRKRRTSPVDAPSSYPVDAMVRTTPACG